LYFVVLRGETGTGKTAILAALSALGAQVLDLEGLASHRGSAFGGLGLPAQPSHDAFGALVEARCQAFDPRRPVYLEHEGPYIGAVGVPEWLRERSRERSHAADGLLLTAPRTLRAVRIAQQYVGVPTSELERALRSMRTRLGSGRTREVRQLVATRALFAAVERLLPYYDQAYQHQLAALSGRTLAVLDSAPPASVIAQQILHLTERL
jgi:tRNA 2-selenouridine synthase